MEAKPINEAPRSIQAVYWLCDARRCREARGEDTSTFTYKINSLVSQNRQKLQVIDGGFA